MSRCELILDHLDAAIDGALPEELAAHLAGCNDCQLAVERARGLAEGAHVLASVTAPESLRRRLKDLPRLAPACENAVERLGAALHGELPEADRAGLLEHMHACPACLALWEALADGRLSTIATDEYTTSLAVKMAGTDIRTTPGGHVGIETRGIRTFSEGVVAGRITLERFAEAIDELVRIAVEVVRRNGRMGGNEITVSVSGSL